MAVDMIRQDAARQMTFSLFLIALATFALLACGGPEERKANYRLKAQEYVRAGNYPKARVALRNVLKIDPKDAEAYYMFAQVEEKEKNWRNAVKLYQEVVEIAPDHTGALITLAKYYLEARLTDHVVSTADKLLEKDRNHPQALALKIAAQAATEEQVPQAIGKAEALAARFPAEPDVAILLATLYGQLQHYRDAERALRRAIEDHPQDLDLLNNLYTILVKAKDPAGAEAVSRRMIETEPGVMDHRLRLAQLFDQEGKPDQAETVLREAVKLDPDSEQRRLLLADFLQGRKRIPAAEAALLDAAAHLPHSTKIQFGLAALYEQSGQENRARECYETLMRDYKSKPAGLDAKVKLAQMDFAKGRLEDAERQAREVLKENPNASEGLVLLGRMALARRNGKEAVQDFRTVLRDQPELAHVQFLLGQAYLMTGESRLARESFERAVALYPEQADARRSLAVIESQSGQLQRARKRLDDLLQQRPDDVMALDMLMNLDLATQNWTEAERTLDRLKVASVNSYVANMAEGRLREAQRRSEEAGRAYERASILVPNEAEPLLALVKLDVAQGRTDKARVRLEAQLATDPDHLFAHGLLGEVLALTGTLKEADAHFQRATKLHPKWTTPWLDWAGMWLAQRRPASAVQVLQAGLQANPESEELVMLLASGYSDEGRMDDAMAAYDRALKLNPRNVLAANNLAVLLTDYKGDPGSLQRAFMLSRDFERDAPHALFLDTLGWVRFKMGQVEDAVRIMKVAVAKSPDVPTLNYHLGIAYYRAGKPAEARKYLSQALKGHEAFQGRQAAEQTLAQMRG